MCFRLDRTALAAIVCVVAACTLCGRALSRDGGGNLKKGGSGYQPGGNSAVTLATAVDPAKRKKMADKLERKLGRLKPQGTSKKGTDDYYLLGTADVNLRNRHADVRFGVKQGQRAVAEFLADYILSQPQGTLRQWHVFYRLKDSTQAQQALLLTRGQYDRMTAYRQQIRKIYKAKASRRC